jgi:hypothetical protein
VERETNCRRAGRDRQRDWGVQSGEGGVVKCSHHRRRVEVDICVVTIFGCHLKDKGNKISRHLPPMRDTRVAVLHNRGRLRNDLLDNNAAD